jgi:DNA (cytosine-5)-methyltransferase 1
MERPALSLFTGAGGLDLGLEAAGFTIKAAVEVDRRARETLRINRPTWKLVTPGDVFTYSSPELVAACGFRSGEIALLSGGPPCQPFSKASQWVTGDTPRLSDPRAATLEAYVSLVEAGLPFAIILENVDGFAYRNKDDGLNAVLSGLDRVNKRTGSRYSPSVFQVNAMDFGVPQRRARTFVVAQRDGLLFRLPSATHGNSAGQTRHATAWDAFANLQDCPGPETALKGKWRDLLPSIPEGANYLWHTPRGGGMSLFGWRTRYWSFLLKLAKDKPSWTIPASPGPATGPFHWDNRRLSVAELKRIQTFPDSYVVTGSLSDVQWQIGNSVPPLLGEVLGRAILEQFFAEGTDEPLIHSLKRSEQPPPAGEVTQVPLQYHCFVGLHPAHPGTGGGPRALLRAEEKEMGESDDQSAAG